MVKAFEEEAVFTQTALAKVFILMLMNKTHSHVFLYSLLLSIAKKYEMWSPPEHFMRLRGLIFAICMMSSVNMTKRLMGAIVQGTSE